jgi:uncharacterized membrane protein YkoI
MKSRRWVAAAAAALAVAGGSGLALAQQGGNAPGPTGPAAAVQKADQPEPGDLPDRVDRPEPGDTADVAGAAEAPDGPGREDSGDAAEKAEAAKLLPQAKVTEQQAAQKALVTSPGTVVEAQLGQENGTIVWEFQVKAPDGSGHEVKVNATTGAVISTTADGID